MPQPSQNRSESDHRLVTSKELTLARLKRDGRASAAKIARLESDIARTSRDILNEWFDQPDRLAAARKHHGLVGAPFREFAKPLGVGGSDAFNLERLSGQREIVFAACEAMEAAGGEPLRFPGWRKALEMALPDVPKYRWANPSAMPDRPPAHFPIMRSHHAHRNRGISSEWSEGDEWRTPEHLFDFLAQHYPFTVMSRPR